MKIFGLGFDGRKDIGDVDEKDLPDVRICVYTTCYNERLILPFFLKHYLSFCNEIVVYDNSSTDDSVKIVSSFANTRVVKYNTGGIRDDILLIMKNNIWKEARGRFDFVIVVDTDEFLYFPDLKRLFRYCKTAGKTVLKPVGYNMISEFFPQYSKPLPEQVRTGVHEWRYNKCVAFDPNRIREINYTVGAHKAVPRGKVRLFKSPDLKLLHYRYLSKESYLDKIKNSRQSDVNRKNNWGSYLDYPEEYHIKLYDEMLKKAKNII